MHINTKLFTSMYQSISQSVIYLHQACSKAHQTKRNPT